MFSGALRVRDRLQVGEDERKVTALSVFDSGAGRSARFGERRARSERCGASARSGSATRSAQPHAHAEHHFAPPTLETAVVPARPGEKGALHVALTQLAEQDPLIDLRQDDIRQELFLSLYGEVQKEVIQETLATDFGIDVEFRETTTICVERPVGTGAAVEDARRGRTRSSPRSGCAWSRPRSTRAWSFGSRWSWGRCRSRSSGRSRTRFARHCARASTAGRSSTARSR